MVTVAMNEKTRLLFGRKAMTNLENILKQRHYFADKCPYSQSYGFSRNQVQMWELDCREGWAPKNLCFQTVVLEKTLESLLDCKIKPVNPKGHQPWNSMEGLMLKLKLQYFSHLMWKAGLHQEKTMMLGKIEGKKGKWGGRGWERVR